MMRSTRRSLPPDRPGNEMYAVIDTNVIVSAMITNDDSSNTVKVLTEALSGDIIPVFSEYLISEYIDVLCREKFSIPKVLVADLINTLIKRGVCVEPSVFEYALKDVKDIPIFAIASESRELGTFLITGNTKHFPDVSYVVTPRVALELLKG